MGKQQIKPTCVFCGGVPISEEHVWPNWLKNVLPKQGPDKTYVRHTHSMPKGYDINRFIKQGHPSRYTVNKFCKSCNNGWMSQIEGQTKPLLESLILGEDFLFTKQAKKDLAIWASLRAIVCDYAATDIQVIREDRRISFYQQPKPLDRVFIWLFKADENEESYNHYTHYGTITSNLYELPNTSNTKAFLLVVGRLIVHILIYNQLYQPYFFPDSIEEKVIQLWPLNNWGEQWGELSALTIKERKSLLQNFSNYNIKHGSKLNTDLGERK